MQSLFRHTINPSRNVVNWANPICRDLRGVWLVNDPVVVYDLTQPYHTGTYNAASDMRGGRFGLVNRFSQGADNYITLGSSPFKLSVSGLTQATISAWIRRKSNQVSSKGAMYFENTSTATNRRFSMEQYALGNTPSHAIVGYANNSIVVTGSSSVTDKWEHRAFTVNSDRDHEILYVNGRVDSDNAGTITAFSAGGNNIISIGWQISAFASDTFAGEIAAVAVWHRELSAGEVLMLNNNPMTMFLFPSQRNYMFAAAAPSVGRIYGPPVQFI